MNISPCGGLFYFYNRFEFCSCDPAGGLNCVWLFYCVGFLICVWIFGSFYVLRAHRCLYRLATRHAPAGLRVTPKGRGGKLQTRQSGDFPPSPLRFHPKNPFLTSLPPFPRFGGWWLRGCFFLGRAYFAFLSPLVLSLKLMCGWGLGRLFFGAGLGEQRIILLYCCSVLVIFLFYLFTILEVEP